jgi:predicted amidohydrolase
MQTRVTVGLAQIDCHLGEVDANLERHLEWIAQAHERGVEWLLFPELSLTGYRLLHLTSRMAMQPATSPVIQKLIQAAGEMTLVVGLVEENEQGVLYNSAVVLDGRGIRHVHRKLYLPTYGIFQEGRFFGAGDQIDLVPVNGRHLGLLICEDLWHPELGRRLARAGAKVLAVISASPGRLGGESKSEGQDIWETITRSTALLNTCWLLYCNRVGWEEGSFYTGCSHIIRPGGQIMARAPFLEEDLLVATIDLREVDRLRWRLPLVRASRSDIEGPA